MHICLFNIECLRFWWIYGVPIRIYFKDRSKYITILSGERRLKKNWGENATLIGPLE